MSGYTILIDVENNSDEPTAVYFADAFINDYKVNAYGPFDNQLPAGKKYSTYTQIYDEELTEKTKDFEYIEATLYVDPGAYRPCLIYKECFE